MYQELVKALNDVGFSGDEVANIHASLASVLHLGNVTFRAAGDGDPANVSSPPAVLAKGSFCVLDFVS